MKKIFNSRALKYGGLATAITAIFLAVIIFLNIFTGIITSKYSINIDLTANKIYELSEKTTLVLGDLTKPVKITVYADENVFANSGDYYTTQFHDILKKIDNYSENVSVVFVDPVKNPSLSVEFPGHDIGPDDIIFSCEGNVRIYPYSEFFNLQQDEYGYTQIASSKVEQTTMTGVLNVVADTR